MIFKRREKRPLIDRLRDLVAPRKGWRRGFRYIRKRVQRLPDTPHRIALGFACGALASFTPLFTLHAFVAILIAWIVRGNLLAAAFGTIVGNPVSFPFIATVCLKFGNWLLGRSNGVESLDGFSFSYVQEHPWMFLESIFTPYLVGGALPGLICAAGFYFVLRPAIAGFQRRRREALAQRAAALVRNRPSAEEKRAANDAGAAHTEQKTAS